MAPRALSSRSTCGPQAAGFSRLSCTLSMRRASSSIGRGSSATVVGRLATSSNFAASWRSAASTASSSTLRAGGRGGRGFRRAPAPAARHAGPRRPGSPTPCASLRRGGRVPRPAACRARWRGPRPRVRAAPLRGGRSPDRARRAGRVSGAIRRARRGSGRPWRQRAVALDEAAHTLDAAAEFGDRLHVGRGRRGEGLDVGRSWRSAASRRSLSEAARPQAVPASGRGRRARPGSGRSSAPAPPGARRRRGCPRCGGRARPPAACRARRRGRQPRAGAARLRAGRARRPAVGPSSFCCRPPSAAWIWSIFGASAPGAPPGRARLRCGGRVPRSGAGRSAPASGAAAPLRAGRSSPASAAIVAADCEPLAAARSSLSLRCASAFSERRTVGTPAWRSIPARIASTRRASSSSGRGSGAARRAVASMRPPSSSSRRSSPAATTAGALGRGGAERAADRPRRAAAPAGSPTAWRGYRPFRRAGGAGAGFRSCRRSRRRGRRRRRALRRAGAARVVVLAQLAATGEPLLDQAKRLVVVAPAATAARARRPPGARARRGGGRPIVARGRTGAALDESRFSSARAVRASLASARLAICSIADCRPSRSPARASTIGGQRMRARAVRSSVRSARFWIASIVSSIRPRSSPRASTRSASDCSARAVRSSLRSDRCSTSETAFSSRPEDRRRRDRARRFSIRASASSRSSGSLTVRLRRSATPRLERRESLARGRGDERGGGVGGGARARPRRRRAPAVDALLDRLQALALVKFFRVHSEVLGVFGNRFGDPGVELHAGAFRHLFSDFVRRPLACAPAPRRCRFHCPACRSRPSRSRRMFPCLW